MAKEPFSSPEVVRVWPKLSVTITLLGDNPSMPPATKWRMECTASGRIEPALVRFNKTAAVAFLLSSTINRVLGSTTCTRALLTP